MKNMSVAEFKAYCRKNDYNIINEWDFNRFDVKCLNCKSNNIQVGHKTKEMGYGSTRTGTWTREEAGLLIKCLKCGRAMTIILKETLY
jgi:hypothetical protein